ncbi:hypothetical protein OWV82_003851 [Melia azedarach]|uniref:Uncharacterized protein n=1 Tax=Melia azedarach TaxID=155640 RepID=A0ACC1YNC0_MELAZ|nr:hypothetical protein OWV82_003851 [Melia azedarach]
MVNWRWETISRFEYKIQVVTIPSFQIQDKLVCGSSNSESYPSKATFLFLKISSKSFAYRCCFETLWNFFGISCFLFLT